MACALLEDGNIRCWGDKMGQLGIESVTDVTHAVNGSDVILPSNITVRSIEVGHYRACAVRMTIYVLLGLRR